MAIAETAANGIYHASRSQKPTALASGDDQLCRASPTSDALLATVSRHAADPLS
jgi:hypothetical protein